MKRKLLEDICENPQGIFNILAGATGVGLGILDNITTGLPLFTIGVPLYEVIGYWNAPKKIKEWAKDMAGDLKPTLLEGIKRYLTYGLYASIPFAVKYHEEIANLFNS